jgi:7-cyano-7-deazaguanine synthase
VRRKATAEETRILLGGGMDSAALLPFYLSRDVEVRGVHFDYGQPSARGERRSVLALARHYDVPVETQSLGLALASTRGEYHCRNALIVLAAASVALRAQLGIAIGIHADSPYYDSTPAFVGDVQRLLDGYHGGTVRVEAPFLEFSKQDVFDYCLESGVPVNLTFSCERRSDRPCRQCASCKDQMALNENNRGLQAT